MGCVLNSPIEPNRFPNLTLEAATEKYTAVEIIVYNVVLFGEKGSGKSTFVKQMKSLHNKTLDKDKLLIEKKQFIQNLVETTNKLSQYANIEIFDYENKTILKKEHYEYLLQFWNESNINSLSDYQLIYTAKYLFENMHSYCSDEYLPSNHDLLHINKPTVGINQFKFLYEDDRRSYEEIYKIYDCPGSKYERIHWLDVIKDIQCSRSTVIIFISSLCNYNQYVSLQYKKINKLQQSINTFGSIINGNLSQVLEIKPNDFGYIHKIDNKTKCIVYGYIHQTEKELKLMAISDIIISICLLYYHCYNCDHINNKFKKMITAYCWPGCIVFLNKIDLFEKMILKYKITDYFSDFIGNNTNKDEIMKFFKDKFRNKRTLRSIHGTIIPIHFHVTSMINTSSIKRIFESCRTIIIKKELSFQGFL